MGSKRKFYRLAASFFSYWEQFIVQIVFINFFRQDRNLLVKYKTAEEERAIDFGLSKDRFILGKLK